MAALAGAVGDVARWVEAHVRCRTAAASGPLSAVVGPRLTKLRQFSGTLLELEVPAALPAATRGMVDETASLFSYALVPIGLGVAAMAAGPAQAADVRLIGSGASFPFPIYATWFKAFSKATPGRHRRLSGQGQRRRHPGLDQPHGRFRGQRRRDDRRADRQGQGRRRAAADDRGRDRARLQSAGRDRAEAAARRLPRDLPGQRHQLERPAHRRRQSRRHPAGHARSPWSAARTAAAPPSSSPSTSSAVSEAFKRRPRLRHHRAVAESGDKHHRRAEERRRDRDDQADARGPSATSSTATPSSARRRSRCCRTSRQVCRRPAARVARSPWRSAKFPSETDLRAWVDDRQRAEAYPIATFTWMLFYKEQDAGQGRGAAPDGRVRPDRRARRLRTAWATSRCPRRVVEKVRPTTAEHPCDSASAVPTGSTRRGSGFSRRAAAVRRSLSTGSPSWPSTIRWPTAGSPASISQPPSAVEFAVDRDLPALTWLAAAARIILLVAYIL